MREEDSQAVREQGGELSDAASRRNFSDEDIQHLAQRCRSHSIRAMLAYGFKVVGIGTILGALVATISVETGAPWHRPVLIAFTIGASLAMYWFPLAIIVELISPRKDRFDRRVLTALEHRCSAHRSLLAGFGLLGLALVALTPTLGLGADAIARIVWMAIFTTVTLALIFMARLKPDTQRIDWRASNLCRRCGYDRGDGVRVCPECGEGATVV